MPNTASGEDRGRHPIGDSGSGEAGSGGQLRGIVEDLELVVLEDHRSRLARLEDGTVRLWHLEVGGNLEGNGCGGGNGVAAWCRIETHPSLGRHPQLDPGVGIAVR
jgi:hypothetical protein